MKKPIDIENHFFVDESGDPTFYDRLGNLIVADFGVTGINRDCPSAPFQGCHVDPAGSTNE